MPTTLRSKVARLAQADPKLRPHLLPILKRAYTMYRENLDKEGNGWGVQISERGLITMALPDKF